MLTRTGMKQLIMKMPPKYAQFRLLRNLELRLFSAISNYRTNLGSYQSN